MKTAKTGTTTATWWSKRDSVSTTTTRLPAAPPALVWPTGTPASWGADNTPAPHPLGGAGSLNRATGWLLLQQGLSGPGRCQPTHTTPAFGKVYTWCPGVEPYLSFEHCHKLIIPPRETWHLLKVLPENQAVGGGVTGSSQPTPVLALSKSAVGSWLGAASSLVLLAFPISAPHGESEEVAPLPQGPTKPSEMPDPSVTSVQLCLSSFSKTSGYFPALGYKYLKSI